jgi:hypothetical protein
MTTSAATRVNIGKTHQTERPVSIADVKQVLRKPLKFNGMRLGFRRQYVVIPLNRRFHLNTTGFATSCDAPKLHLGFAPGRLENAAYAKSRFQMG